MSYAFNKDAKDGDTVTLANGVRYQYEEAKDRWMVRSVQDKDECPRFDAVAARYKDYDNPKEQIVISWFANGQQDGVLNVGFSEVRLCNFPQKLDPKDGWISIDGNKHQVFEETELSGDPVYTMLSAEGDLTHYVGRVVEVHACDEKEQCGDDPEPEAIVGAFRCAHADGTPPLLLEGEMVFSSPWGTLRPSEIMTLRISTLDSKSEPIPDGIFEPNKEFSLYRSQAGLPIKVATLSPYMVNISSYQTGGEYYELALDTNKTQFFEQCEEGVDYFLTDNVHNFDRTPATAWFGIMDARGDYVLIKEKEELDDFFAEENWRFWSGYNVWANTVTEAHPYLVWKDIHSIQLPCHDVGPINYTGKTRLDEYISEGMTIKIVDRFAFENYGVYEVLEFKKVQAPTWYSWNDILDPNKDPSGYVDSYHLKVKCIEGRGESLLNKTGGNSGFGLHSEDEAELSPEEIAAVSSSPVQRFWIAKATGEGPTDRLTNRESVSTLPTFGSRYAPDQSDTLIGAFNRDYRVPDYHLDVQHYNRIDHVNSRGEEYDIHYGGGTTTFIGQGWSRYDKAYYEFTYDWSSKPGAGRDLDNFNHVQVQDPELPVNKARTTVTFAVESVPRVRFYCSDTEDENSIITEIKTAVAIGASRKTHPLYMYWREESDNTHYYNQIKRLGDPSEEYDATNKKYVDGKMGRMVSRSAVAEAFTKIQRAVSDETTLEGLKQSLVNSLGGLIEELEHEHD